jgi:hypothetical protein
MHKRARSYFRAKSAGSIEIRHFFVGSWEALPLGPAATRRQPGSSYSDISDFFLHPLPYNDHLIQNEAR